MVLRKDTNRLMDELWALGARGILVTDIHACRLYKTITYGEAPGFL
jgi:ATP phosphoribosyltransferase